MTTGRCGVGTRRWRCRRRRSTWPVHCAFDPVTEMTLVTHQSALVVWPMMSVMMWVVVLVRMQSLPLGPMAMGVALAVVVLVV